jgi:hypothetical protein
MVSPEPMATGDLLCGDSPATIRLAFNFSQGRLTGNRCLAANHDPQLLAATRSEGNAFVVAGVEIWFGTASIGDGCEFGYDLGLLVAVPALPLAISLRAARRRSRRAP